MWEWFVPSQSLISMLESSYLRYPGLFSLSCASLIMNRGLKLSTFHQAVESQSAWFFFPLLLYFHADAQTQPSIAAFIAKHAFDGDLEPIFFLACFFGSVNSPKDNANLSVLTQALVEQAKTAERAALVFALVTSSTAFALRTSKPSRVDLLRAAEIPNWPADEIAALEFRRTQFREGKEIAEGVFWKQAEPLFETVSSLPFFPASDAAKPWKSTCAEVVRALTSKGDSAARKHLKTAIKERLTARYQTTIRALFHSLGRKSPSSTAGLTESRGRISGKFEVQTRVEMVRANSFCRFWPMNLVRRRRQNMPERLLSPAPPFNGALKLVFPSQTLSAQLAFSSTGLQFRTEVFVRDVPFHDITVWLQMSEHTLQLVSIGFACLIDHSPVPSQTVFSSLEGVALPDCKICAKSLDRIGHFVDRYRQKWLNWDVTTFEYLTMLNLLSGRSFSDPAARFCFPPPSGSSPESADGGHWNDAFAADANQYFSPENADEKSFGVVYANRKDLESLPGIELWISQAFGRKCANYRSLIDQPHLLRPPFRPAECQVQQFDVDLAAVEDKITFCHFLSSKNGATVFATVRKSGKIEFISVFFENGMAKSASNARPELLSMGTKRYFGFAEGLFAYDGESLMAFCEAGQTRDFAINHIRSGSLSVSEWVCQVSSTELCLIDSDKGLRAFAALPAAISCFAMSRPFNITAVGCEDGKLRIRSNENGRKVCTVDLDSEVPTNVLVTRRWGFVVVKTGQSIFVFTVNGILVKKAASSKPIRLWCCYYSRDGFDFVAYQDADRDICYFEAVEPDQLLRLDPMRNIAGMSYDWRNDCFLFLVDTGKIIVMPSVRPAKLSA
jgi:hypothetical protein